MDELGRRAVCILAVRCCDLPRVVVISFALILLACDEATSGVQTASSTPAAITASSTSKLMVAGDSLRLMQHEENLPAGFPLAVTPVTVKDPYEGNQDA